MTSASESKVIWTIGHSTHSFEEFKEMLDSFGIKILVDIRSYPGSRKFPQFNKENLSEILPLNNIQYIHLAGLGGRRKENANSHNTAWKVAAFRAYADFMETDSFLVSVKELQEIAIKQRTAIMCSEALWWRCHRSLVSDFLKLNNWKVLHIMNKTSEMEHPYTSPARIINGVLSYQ